MNPPPPIPNTSSDVVQDMLFSRPVQSKVPLLRAVLELPRLLRVSPKEIGDLLRAMGELALANRALRKQPIGTFGLLGRGTDTSPAPVPLTSAQHLRIDRVRRAFEVVAPRVPWRSDCLVQCVAGRRWLARYGIATRIAIGVKRDENAALLAHAWLCAGDAAQALIVTGGDVSDFDEFRPVRRKSL